MCFIFACFVYNIRNKLKRQRHAKYCCCSVLRNYIKTDLSRIFIHGGTFNTLWLINSHIDVWKLIRELFIIICLLIIVTFCFALYLLRMFVNNDCLCFCVLWVNDNKSTKLSKFPVSKALNSIFQSNARERKHFHPHNIFDFFVHKLFPPHIFLFLQFSTLHNYYHR